MTFRIITLLTVVVLLSACGGASSIEEGSTSEIIPDISESTSPDTSIPTLSADTTSVTPVTSDTPVVDDLSIISVEQSNHGFDSAHFSGSNNCAQCHDGITDETGEDLSIVKSWKTTMMANSARDPFWKAKVASEVKRNPALSETIQGKCARCHMPMAHVEATFNDESTTLFGDGFLSPENPHFDEAADGVSCTLCHQIENTSVFGTEDATSGNFVISKDTTDRKLYGPFADPIQGPMINNSGFTPMGSDHIKDSALCGSCHDVKTPIVDTASNLTANEFPEQMVYSEWQHSDFSAAAKLSELSYASSIWKSKNSQ